MKGKQCKVSSQKDISIAPDRFKKAKRREAVSSQKDISIAPERRRMGAKSTHRREGGTYDEIDELF